MTVFIVLHFVKSFVWYRSVSNQYSYYCDFFHLGPEMRICHCDRNVRLYQVVPLSPHYPLPQPSIPLISEARSDFFVCHVFLVCASWIWLSLPRCCGCQTLSKPPRFSSFCFWRVLYEILYSLSLLWYFVLTFSQLRVFLSILSTRMLWPLP